MPLRTSIVSLSAAGLLLSGCVGQQEEESQEKASSYDAALESFYEQDLSWEDCEDEMRCATVRVPADYSDPDGAELGIDIISSETAEGEDPPFLLTNPGGPGASGVDLVIETGDFLFASEVTQEYNILGFDPRGVDRSAPVECLSDAEMDAYRETEQDTQLDEDAAYEQALEDSAELGEKCLQNTGDSLGYVDTVSAARDMDIIRAAVGQETLDYLGFSYGTKLGLAYAEHFPESMGRFVLDGVMDVSISSHELSLAQAEGFEDALHRYAQWCVDQQNCPVEGGADDVVSAVQDLFSEVEAEPAVGADGRTVTAGTLVSGFILPMYDALGWPLLSEALEGALTNDDYLAFQAWADQQAGRGLDGSYDWKSQLAFTAIMCLDYPMSEDQERIEEEFAETLEASPTFGPYLGHSGVQCSQWPFENVLEPWEPDLSEAPEMLLIGTTGDPATPVEWAENIHDQVPGSSLLVSESEGHLAYRPGNDCVVEEVDAFLLDGELFEGRQECQ